MLLEPDVLEQYFDDIHRAIEEGKVEDVARLSQHLSSARVADLLTEAPRELIVGVFQNLPANRAGRILGLFPPAFAAELLHRHTDVLVPAILQHTPLDQAADILQSLPSEQADALIQRMNPSFRQKVGDLRRYPEGSAGSVMEPHFFTAHAHRTVGELRKALLASSRDYERTNTIFIVDEDNQLLGALPIQQLFRADLNSRLGDIMDPQVVALRVDDTAIEAAELLQDRRLATVPILDDRGSLVGVVTFEDAIDILASDVAQKFVRAGAVYQDESFFTPPIQAVRGRLPWMAFNVFLNLGAVWVITGFEDTIAQVAILAAFLPMITDMGGNVGIQSLSVSIRSIALDEVRLRDFWRGVRKEVFIGLINGAALGTLFALIAWAIQGMPALGLIAGVALGCNVLLAGVVGGTLPFIIKRFGKDPAMMTGPFLTTITDITGVTIYLGLATIFLTDLLGSGILT